MSKFSLPSSENYHTIIGYSEVYKRLVYQVENKIHGVIEFETPMYGTLLAVFDALQQAVEEGEEDVFNDPNVVDFPKTH